MPLLLISTNVMIAIRISGMLWPAMVSANTSLGLGHGACVDIRTVMYEIRNEPKMNVSESRKIHIIALPQGTFLNARWSDDQSATTPGRPSLSGAACPALASAVCVMCVDPLYRWVLSSTKKSAAQTSSRKCQYMVQSSTDSRTFFDVDAAHGA